MAELSQGLKDMIHENTKGIRESKAEIQAERAAGYARERFLDESMTKLVDFLIEHYIPEQPEALD